ncbi:hypothetical protein FNU76_04470 [Chitinimonas arctica]|uniref:Imm33-like domain-containing protein n=1 Tax=Chitinimonas arctica TaxID=2594795 RepID=A0A516SBZ4_9NEIS|nr:hypothetical protein [Chitinimonas arctica]QDQ25664.1 hypothetical protein FNU76_04470 [Chitinimonas arctica]
MQFESQQKSVCEVMGVPFTSYGPHMKVGISKNVLSGLRPLNGLRIQPEGDTCGWYIWAGEVWFDAPDFFVPLHAVHLNEWAPLVLKYLGLPPGWRFLVTEKYEDMWEDLDLLTNKPSPLSGG